MIAMFDVLMLSSVRKIVALASFVVRRYAVEEQIKD
jgi:hypothetical protein